MSAKRSRQVDVERTDDDAMGEASREGPMLPELSQSVVWYNGQEPTANLDASAGIHSMLQYTTPGKKGETAGTETLLLLQCSGRVLAFSRAWPYPETDAPVMTQIGPEGQGMALLPAIEDAGSLTHLSFIKMPRLSWIAVCIGRKIRLHDTGKEKLRQGLGCETDTEKVFCKRVPPPVEGSAAGLSFHPTDKNLYAVPLTDGTLAIKSFQLENADDFQLMGTPTGCPSLVEFSTSGEWLLVVRSSGAGAELHTHRVPETSLAPQSSTPKRYEFEVGEEGDAKFAEASRVAKAEKEDKKKRLEQWKENAEDNNTGTKLLNKTPTNGPLSLDDLGMPLHMLPINGGQRYNDYVLLSYPNEIQLWCAAPIRKEAVRRIEGVRSVKGFEWLDGAQYWLVGTSAAEIHLLKALGTGTKEKRTPGAAEVLKQLHLLATVRVLEDGTAPVPITAISTLSGVDAKSELVHQTDKISLFLGFADGNVRSYPLSHLFTIAAQRASAPA